MEIWVFVLCIIWLVLLFRGEVHFNSTFRSAFLAITFFSLFVAWVLLQSIPLPSSIIASLSPETHGIYHTFYQNIGLNTDYTPLSLNHYHSYNKFLETLTYFLLFCLTLLLVNSVHRIRLFAGIIVLSGIFQAIYGSLMTLSGIEYILFIEKEIYRDVATGTFINRNHLAGYLEMCLAIGIGLLISTLHETKSVNWQEFFRRTINNILGSKIRLRIGLAIMVIALVLTHSRMGNSAFFFSLSFVGVLYLLIVKKPPRSVLILFISLFVIDVLIVGTWFGIDKVAQRLENTSVSSETRDEVVRDSLTMFKDYPLTGTGGKTYYFTFKRYQGDDVLAYYDHAHNDYLEFLTEYGVIGISFLTLLVFSSLVSSLMALRKRAHTLLKGMAFASTMGIIALLIHSTVDFNLQIPANAALFIVLLALGQISLHLKLR